MEGLRLGNARPSERSMLFGIVPRLLGPMTSALAWPFFPGPTGDTSEKDRTLLKGEPLVGNRPAQRLALLFDGPCVWAGKVSSSSVAEDDVSLVAECHVLKFLGVLWICSGRRLASS